MAQKLVNECDECGSLQKEANHWFRSKMLDGGEYVLAAIDSRSEIMGTISDSSILCGEACVTKNVGKYLAKKNGQFAVFAALAMALLGVIVGLALDLGTAYVVKSRLQAVADAAALAGASVLNESEERVGKSACDAARLNGMPCGETEIEISIGEFDSGEEIVPAVFAEARREVPTSFMRLGALFGCSNCRSIPVSALGVAVVPLGLDISLVVDDTESMRRGCEDIDHPECPSFLARQGAMAFVDAFLPRLAGARIALTPFRGCYNNDGEGQCVKEGEKIGLIENAGLLKGVRGTKPEDEYSQDTGTGIEGLWSQGGSGTNLCLALKEGGKAFEANSIAPKVLVIVTDAENHKADAPPCDFDGTKDEAEKLKDDGVEIYVLGYSVADGDQGLAGGIASPGNYFEAETEEEIPERFREIAREILSRVRLAM